MNKHEPFPGTPRQIFAILALLLATLSMGYMFYATGKRDLLRREHDRLNAVAELKAQQLGDWLAERKSDAEFISEGIRTSRSFTALMKQKSGQGREFSLQWLEVIKKAYNCKSLILLDSKGGTVLSTDPSDIPTPDEIARAKSAMDSGRVMVNDLARGVTGRIYMDIIAPMTPRGSKSILGAIVMRFDPNASIYRFLQSWPNPSRTGETLLVRRDGKDVLYLNELRHRKGTALTMRLPVDSQRLPASMALRGFQGFAEGVDYRGVKVLSAVRAISGTPWFLVTKIDADEVYAPLHLRAASAVVLSGLLLAGATLLLIQIWLRREREYLKNSLLETERSAKALAESEENISVTLSSIGDGVIATDERGIVTRINRVAEELTGWPASDAIGLPLNEVFVIVNEDSRLPVDDPVLQVLETGMVVGLANHTILIARDGRELPIADSGAPIRGKDSRTIGVVLVFRDQTEERKQQRLILESLNYHLSLFNDFPALIWRAGVDGKCDYFNRTWLDFRGRSMEEELGNGWIEGVHPEDVDSCLQTYMTAFNYRDPFEMQYRLRHHDGEYRWIKDIGRPFRGPDGAFAGYIGSCYDITEQKKAQDLIRSSNALLRKVFDAVPDMLLVLDRDRRVIHSNRHGILEDLPAEIRLDKPHCYKILQPTQEGFCDSCQTLQVMDSGQPTVTEFTLPGHRLFEVRTYPIIDESGFVSMVVKNYRDITEHRKTEEQLRHAQKMEALGTLAGGIAHDFNNILTAIVGYGNILKDRFSESDPHSKELKQILVAANKAAALTKSLLAYSRKSALSLKTVDLNEIIKNIDNFLARIIGEDIEIKIIPYIRKLPLMADSCQIEQVIMNLATNARDAMPAGGRLLIEAKKTFIDRNFINKFGYGKDGEYALLTISDTGCGMTKEVCERIFEPFFTTKEAGHGTGLGLSIVYGIVKQHKGYINVSSEPGEGTTFHVYLPLTASIQKGKDDLVPVPAKGKGETILIIEDNAEIRTLVSKVLHDFGYRVIEADNGDEGIEIFNRMKGEVDLLILDVIMPGKNGMAIYDHIRSVSPAAKAIFMSGYTADLISSRGIETNQMELLVKPFSPAELLDKITLTLKRSSIGIRT